MRDCGQGNAGALRESCAVGARDKLAIILFLYIVKRFELNGRANDERQAVIIRINGCLEQRLFTPGPTAIPKGVRPARRLKGSSSQTKTASHH
jgi:hypothetical protein